MPTPIPFADDGGTATWRARHALPRPTLPYLAVPLRRARATLLLPFMAAAAWLAWMCFQGVMGTPGAVITLVGIAALAALIRRHTGMEVGMALCFIAIVGLAVLVWVVFALVALALITGG